jgi:hypothetical protein
MNNIFYGFYSTRFNEFFSLSDKYIREDFMYDQTHLNVGRLFGKTPGI